MSGIDRSRYVPASLTIAAILVICFGSGAYYFGLGQTAGYSEAQTQHYQAEFAERTSQRIAGCFEGVTAPRECIEKAIRDNREHQRNESDLQAQQEMAEWAFWMLIISGTGLGVTSIGTAFLAWQVKLTREAVTDTGNATEAVIEANKIARENVAIQTRAWLTPDKYAWDTLAYPAGVAARFNIKFRNTGGSPSLKSRTYARGQLIRPGEPTPHFHFNQADSILGDSSAWAIGPSQTCYTAPVHLTIEEWADVAAQRMHFYIHARVAYFDIFDQTVERVTEATMLVQVSPDGLSEITYHPKGPQNTAT